MKDSYEGGFELRPDDRHEGDVSVRSKFGYLHLSLSVSSRTGTTTTTMDLTPDQAHELAGALQMAARAAKAYEAARPRLGVVA